MDAQALANPRPAALWAGLLIGLGSGLLALITVIAGPVISFGLLAGVGIGLFVLTNLMAGLVLMLAAIAVLPFATLPVRVAITPTFIDLALIGFVLVYTFQWMTGRRRDFRFVPAGALILVFAGFMLFSFVAGLSNASPTTSTLRKFVEMLLSVLLPIILVDVARDERSLRRLALAIILAGAAQALIGLALFSLNDVTAERILNALGRFGYPQGGVIRYIEDNPELGERAIGTWVDPNAYGGFLMMVAALAGVQILAEKPVTGRRWLALVLFVPLAGAVLLSQSRGAWVGLAVAVAFVAFLRYRWLLVAGTVAALVLFSLPFMQGALDRLVEGLTGQDLATQMRFGEYKDAFTLIGRYPLIGVGFTGTPDRDIYLGVSSTYLKLANSMGLTGLALFALIMLETFRYSLRRWRKLVARPELLPAWLGFAAGLVGVLVNGVVDHYYFNLEFHGAATMLWVYVGLTLAAARAAGTDGEQAPAAHQAGPVPIKTR
jgi:O-antigen ligase